MASQPSQTPSAPFPKVVAGIAPQYIALLAFVIVAWGLNWVVMKIVVQELSPLWAVAMRTIIASLVLIPALLLTRQFIVPRRSDVPIILVISLFHMVGFAALTTAGLKYLSAGRSIVLSYTTPLWVAAGAFLFLNEPISRRQIFGIMLGMIGLLLLFDPNALAWQDKNALLGNALVLLAAVSWSVSIVYTRAHRWTATPFQLVLWQTLLAAAVLSLLAIGFEGTPKLALSSKAVLSLAYNGAIGTALGFWAMTVVNKNVPALTASLGVLCTPIVGIGLSALVLGEAVDPKLLLSALMILAGIALGIGTPVRIPALPGRRKTDAIGRER